MLHFNKNNTLLCRSLGPTTTTLPPERLYITESSLDTLLYDDNETSIINSFMCIDIPMYEDLVYNVINSSLGIDAILYSENKNTVITSSFGIDVMFSDNN